MRYHPPMSRVAWFIGIAVLAATLGLVPVTAEDPPVAFEPMQPETFAAGANLVNAFADLEGDGDPDLFVGFDGAANRLYRNERGMFTDIAAAAGVADARATRASAFGDYDADGDPDLLLGFTPGPAGPVLRLYRNDGERFTDQTAAAGLVVATGAVRQPAWVDADGDGDLDLFVGFRDRPNALFRNDGGRFSDVAPALGLADPRKTVGAVWFDADEDGDLDVAVANMDGDANGLFLNDQGRFTDAAEAAGVAWGGRPPRDPGRGTVRLCAADMDGDGRLDLLAANYGPLGFFTNRGGGRFDDRAAAVGAGRRQPLRRLRPGRCRSRRPARSVRQRDGHRRHLLQGRALPQHRRRRSSTSRPPTCARSRPTTASSGPTSTPMATSTWRSPGRGRTACTW